MRKFILIAGAATAALAAPALAGGSKGTGPVTVTEALGGTSKGLIGGVNDCLCETVGKVGSATKSAVRAGAKVRAKGSASGLKLGTVVRGAGNAAASLNRVGKGGISGHGVGVSAALKAGTKARVAPSKARHRHAAKHPRTFVGVGAKARANVGVGVKAKTYVATPRVKTKTYVSTPGVKAKAYVAATPVRAKVYVAAAPVKAKAYVAAGTRVKTKTRPKKTYVAPAPAKARVKAKAYVATTPVKARAKAYVATGAGVKVGAKAGLALGHVHYPGCGH